MDNGKIKWFLPEGTMLLILIIINIKNTFIEWFLLYLCYPEAPPKLLPGLSMQQC